jgi:hypothetical protein
VIEEPFYPIPASPSPVLRGLDPLNLPPLLGYNGTSAKKTARLDLITPRGDPLLASWQYGLGRAAVWTSDLKGQWASSWLDWEAFPRFAAQLIGWTLPAPRADDLSIKASLQENQAVIQVDAFRPDGSPYNFLTGSVSLVDPELGVKEIALKQVAAGRYLAQTAVNIPGVYLARVGVNDNDDSLGQATLGLVVPYSPEYKATGVDLSFLERLALQTGGGQIVDTAEVFTHNLPSIPGSREIWLPLLVLAALLFPLDVAVRRLSIRKKDLLQMVSLLKTMLSPTLNAQTEHQPKLLSGLFEARQRARNKGEKLRESNTHPYPTEQISKSTAMDKSITTGGRPENQDDSKMGDGESSSNIDPLSRLREAKKRARR